MRADGTVPAGWRRIDLPDDVDRVLQDDVRFFRRHRDRRHRIRVMSAAELATSFEGARPDEAMPEGWRWFVTVRIEADGSLALLMLMGPERGETDVSEELARDLFEFTDRCGPTAMLVLHGMRCEAREARQ